MGITRVRGLMCCYTVITYESTEMELEEHCAVAAFAFRKHKNLTLAFSRRDNGTLRARVEKAMRKHASVRARALSASG